MVRGCVCVWVCVFVCVCVWERGGLGRGLQWPCRDTPIGITSRWRGEGRRWREKKIRRVIKRIKEDERGRGRKEKRERKAGAEETLEMTACKYANGGPLKWRWRGGRIKSSERCVIMDQFAAIKPPYGWSLWNGEISDPQGQPWWQWRSQTTGVTEGGHTDGGRGASEGLKEGKMIRPKHEHCRLSWRVG